MKLLGDMSNLAPSTVAKVEAGEPVLLTTYARLARSLGLHLELQLVDPRARRLAGATRQADAVHAAMGEAEAAHLRRHGFEIRLDEPYQHFQFAGRADLVAWSTEPPALLHIENKTELADLQDLFGTFNAKRSYLGPQLASRAGVRRWVSETHVIAALWSSDVLRTLRRHRASFESVCPDNPDAFERWWSGTTPPPNRNATLILFDPAEGRRADRRHWIGASDVDGVRPRYRDYSEAAAELR